MRLCDLLKKVNKMYPNRFSEEQKMEWVNEVEASVATFLKKSYASVTFPFGGGEWESIPFENIVGICLDGKRVAKEDWWQLVTARGTNDRTPRTVTVTYLSSHPEYHHKEMPLYGATFTGNTVTFSKPHPFCVGDALELSESDFIANNCRLTVCEADEMSVTVSETFSEEGTATAGIAVRVPTEELLAPLPFSQMYEAYLEAKIAYYHNDWEAYNHGMERFNRIYEQYAVCLKEREPARNAEVHGLW